MVEVMSDGVDHSHFIVKPDYMVVIGQGFNILDVRHGNPQGYLPVWGNHGIGAEPSIPGQVEHVGRLGEQ
jgi:hypothetical protein